MMAAWSARVRRWTVHAVVAGVQLAALEPCHATVGEVVGEDLAAPRRRPVEEMVRLRAPERRRRLHGLAVHLPVALLVRMALGRETRAARDRSSSHISWAWARTEHSAGCEEERPHARWGVTLGGLLGHDLDRRFGLRSPPADRWSAGSAVARLAFASPKPRQQPLARVALEQPLACLVQARNVRYFGPRATTPDRQRRRRTATPPVGEAEQHVLAPHPVPRLRPTRAPRLRPLSLLPNAPASRPTSPSCLLLFLPRASAPILPVAAVLRPGRGGQARPSRAGAVRAAALPTQGRRGARTPPAAASAASPPAPTPAPRASPGGCPAPAAGPRCQAPAASTCKSTVA